ncbi:MAG: response regulator [Thermoplasmatota archaeon]
MASVGRPGPVRTDLGRKVLVADDEPDVLESTALVVESLGYRALRVAEATDILATAQQDLPDLILQDLQMPGLDVDLLMDSLRGDSRTQGIPVVLFSASRDLSSVAARHDVWGFLAKPFGLPELKEMLRQALGEPGHPSPPESATWPTLVAAQGELLAGIKAHTNLLQVALAQNPKARLAVAGIQDLVGKFQEKTAQLGGLLQTPHADRITAA